MGEGPQPHAQGKGPYVGPLAPPPRGPVWRAKQIRECRGCGYQTARRALAECPACGYDGREGNT